jgi:hypothetical protein
LDGKSIVPLLRDSNAAWPYAAVTSHGFKNHTVRTEDWRYIRYANGEDELYNETSDPLEYTNLARDAKYAAKIQELARYLPAVDAPNLPGAEGGNGKGKGNAKNRAKDNE